MGAVTEVVEAAFYVSEETTGGGPHAVAIGAFDDSWGGREGSTANRVVFGTGPKTENHKIGPLKLPPLFVSNLGRGNPKNRIILNV